MTDRRPLPGTAALDWARALLLDAAERDRSGALAAGLSRFDSWESLAGLAETPWLAPARRPSALASRRARHRLRLLGSAPASFAAAAGQGSAEPVHLHGLCARRPGAAPTGDGDSWRREILDDGRGRWLTDEGHDFTLTGSDGEVALVLAAGGRLVNAARLRPGDQVLGFRLRGPASRHDRPQPLAARTGWSDVGPALGPRAAVARLPDQAVRSG